MTDNIDLVDHLSRQNAALIAALQKAAHELNIIRARDGAPMHIDWYQGRPLQTTSCTLDHFNDVVEECFAALKLCGVRY